MTGQNYTGTLSAAFDRMRLNLAARRALKARVSALRGREALKRLGWEFRDGAARVSAVRWSSK